MSSGKKGLINDLSFNKWCVFSGCSAVRLARFVRDEEAGSSNLPIPTSVSLKILFYGYL
jgi:hypothetical protein